MNTYSSSFKFATRLCLLLYLTFFGVGCATNGYTTKAYNSARNQVRNQRCVGDTSVDKYLAGKFRHRNHSSRWRTFARKGGYDVERAVKVSKFAELRYRWRVNSAGSVKPASFRARTLCSR